jgi:heavy metal translocating P-type ATPase
VADSGVVPCRLCASPVRQGHFASGSSEAFCCAGCANVWEVLAGLPPSAAPAYLEAARRFGVIPRDGAGGSASRAAEMLPVDPEVTRDERVRVEGLLCPSCAWVAEQVLSTQPGVIEARVDFLTGTGLLRLDLRRSSVEALARVLRSLGYGLAPVASEGQSRISRRFTFDFVVSAAITTNLMSIAAIRYAHDVGWTGAEPAFLPWIELLLCVPVMILGWLPGARRAIAGLAAGRGTMDLLVALSAGAAFFLSLASMALGRDDIYFETAAGLVTISLLSRMVEARLRENALRETSLIMRLETQKVRVPGPAWVEVGALRPGDIALFEPGEIVPLDGTVAGAGVLLGEAVLTGEPRPVWKGPGRDVESGSQLLEGTLKLRVRTAYAHSGLAQVAAGLRESLNRGEARPRTADRLATVFVPVTLLVALGAWLVRVMLWGWAASTTAAALFPSIAVLAVACPCAFSLAGASALTAATGVLLRHGFLLRDPGQLEVLAGIRSVIFDKTGTLTAGDLRVVGLSWKEGPVGGALTLVRRVETGALHPAAKAILDWLASDGASELSKDSALCRDEGLVAELAGQGRSISGPHGPFLVGSASLFTETFVPDLSQPWHTRVFFGSDGRAQGCFLLDDTLRPDAAAAVRDLHEMPGTPPVRVEILSGDGPDVTRWMAGQVGADAATGGATLKDKVTFVREREGCLEREPPTRRGDATGILYVGDGTNDALAMAEASTSLAISSSTDEALTAAGIVMTHTHLGEIPWLFGLARRTRRIVRGNHIWAFTFNGLFIPLAAAGLLTPLAAMLLMLASSSAVLLNARRVSPHRALARAPR